MVTDTTPPLQTAGDDAVRNDYQTYLAGLQSMVTAMQQNPYTRESASNAAHDPQAALAIAQQQLPKLSHDQLQVLSYVLGQDPNWKQQPAVVAKLIKQVGPGPNPPTAPSRPHSSSDSNDPAHDSALTKHLIEYHEPGASRTTAPDRCTTSRCLMNIL